jgi:putative tricarboxylic transport membrane protein
MEQSQDKPAASRRTMEIAVTLVFLLFGLVVCWDSWRIGARWGSDGPQAGYFPFYIGLIINICSLITLVQAFRMKAADNVPFVLRGQLKMVTLVMVPTIVYVGLINWLGIYVASTIYIALFMWWLGKYSWIKYVSVSLGVSVAFFLMFEIWFKVPLPKGPLESALGLN